MTESNLCSFTPIMFLLLCYMKPPPFKHSLPTSYSTESHLADLGGVLAQAYFFTYLVIFNCILDIVYRRRMGIEISYYFVLFSEKECLKDMLDGWPFTLLQELSLVGAELQF